VVIANLVVVLALTANPAAVPVTAVKVAVVVVNKQSPASVSQFPNQTRPPLRSGTNLTTTCAAEMKLADNSCWRIAAGNTDANAIVSHFANITGLNHLYGVNPHILVFEVGDDIKRGQLASHYLGKDVGLPADHSKSLGKNPLLPLSVFYHEEGAICELKSNINNRFFNVRLIQLSLVMARDIQNQGGLLLHGALAEWNGLGVILAGPGGVGKTTASNRLPSTWNSLCDDITLVVRDNHGQYWAHPWPTWSRFWENNSKHTWQVEKAVPLAGIYFLTQAQTENVLPIGPGQASILQLESNEQITRQMLHANKDDIRTHRMQCFDYISDLALSVPTYILELSLTGTFWRLLEDTLNANYKNRL